MAIVDGLTTLADIKALLNVPTADTSRDTQLELLITQASAMIQAKLYRSLKRATVVSEPHRCVDATELYLDNRPIQSVSSVKLAGVSLASSIDGGYFMASQDSLAGRLYRKEGWLGAFLGRGLMADPYEGTRQIEVSYIYGYYLPADVGYSRGSSSSLPDKFRLACNAVVRHLYNQTLNFDLPQVDMQEVFRAYGIGAGSL